jgi:hypothetical protein
MILELARSMPRVSLFTASLDSHPFPSLLAWFLIWGKEAGSGYNEGTRQPLGGIEPDAFRSMCSFHQGATKNSKLTFKQELNSCLK